VLCVVQYGHSDKTFICRREEHRWATASLGILQVSITVRRRGEAKPYHTHHHTCQYIRGTIPGCAACCCCAPRCDSKVFSKFLFNGQQGLGSLSSSRLRSLVGNQLTPRLQTDADAMRCSQHGSCGQTVCRWCCDDFKLFVTELHAHCTLASRAAARCRRHACGPVWPRR